MRKVTRSAILAGLAFGFVMQAHTAKAVVLVLGNGLAHDCYEAALAISKGLIYIPPIVTGTLIDMRPVDLCTAALDDRDLTGRDLAGTYVNRGVLEFIGADYAAALKDFDKSVAIDDSIGEAHANRGATLVAMKRWADSIQAIDKGIALGSAEMEKSYYNRAIANEELGNIKGAYYDYQKALELKPGWEQPTQQLTRFSVRKKGDAPDGAK